VSKRLTIENLSKGRKGKFFWEEEERGCPLPQKKESHGRERIQSFSEGAKIFWCSENVETTVLGRTRAEEKGRKRDRKTKTATGKMSQRKPKSG